MARGIKKTGLNVDSSIQEAAKRAKTRRSQLEEAGGMVHNEADDLNNELDRMGEDENIRKIFED